MNQPYQASGQNKPAAAKWLWITLIVVVLLGGAFAAWYFLMGPGKAVESSTTTTTTTAPVDETADWKTYTNTVWKFSFKYPSSYTITSDNLPKTFSSNTGTKDSLILTDSQDTNKPTLTIYANPAGWGYENYNKEISTDENYSVDGINTTLYYSEDTSNNSRQARVLPDASSGISYFIMLTHNSTNDYLTQFKGMLSTFQFTK